MASYGEVGREEQDILDAITASLLETLNHPKFKCRQCDLEYSSQAELADHMDRRHQQASEVGRGERTGKYPCARCYQTFGSEYAASVHPTKHSWCEWWAEHEDKTNPKFRFISCPFRTCHMGFKNKAELEVHLLRVHPEFRCNRSGCGEGFHTEDELNEHIWYTHGLF